MPSETIRYGESLGLLPQAARSHGYRVFDSDSLRYVAFIGKSKAIGLTLAEMREILRMVRAGHCPCPSSHAPPDPEPLRRRLVSPPR